MNARTEEAKRTATIRELKKHLERYHDDLPVYRTAAEHGASTNVDAVVLDGAMTYIEAATPGTSLTAKPERWEGTVKHYATDGTTLAATTTHMVYASDQAEAEAEIHKVAATVRFIGTFNQSNIPVERFEIVSVEAI